MASDIRAHAEKRLKDRRQFWVTLVTFIVVFVLLVIIWGVTSHWSGYFWPVWPAIGFAFALVMQALHTFGPLGRPITDEAIDREVQRLGGSGE